MKFTKREIDKRCRLMIEAGEAFDAVNERASARFKKAIGPAWEAYKKAQAPHLAAYREAIRPTWKAYLAARKEYGKTLKPE